MPTDVTGASKIQITIAIGLAGAIFAGGVAYGTLNSKLDQLLAYRVEGNQRDTKLENGLNALTERVVKVELLGSEPLRSHEAKDDILNKDFEARLKKLEQLKGY